MINHLPDNLTGNLNPDDNLRQTATHCPTGEVGCECNACGEVAGHLVFVNSGGGLWGGSVLI